MGSKWNEVVGNWGIVGNVLVEDWDSPVRMGTPYARIIGNTKVPIRSAPAMRASVQVWEPEINDIFYLYLALKTQTATTPHASFTYTALNTWLVTLSSGESKVMHSLPNGYGFYNLYACIESEHFLFSGDYENVGDQNCAFKAYVNNYLEEYPWETNVGMGDGQYYGLGHNNPSTGAVFDNYSIEEFRSPNGQPDTEYPDMCTSCFCRCYETILDKQLSLTITNAVGRAYCLEGIYAAMDWVWDVTDLDSTHYGTWYGEYLYVRTGYRNWEHLFKWRLMCEESGGNFLLPFDHLVLSLEEPQPCCPAHNCTTLRPIPELSSCDPLILVYGPFTIFSSDLTCGLCFDPTEPGCLPSPPLLPSNDPNCLPGTYYVTITER